MWKKQDVTTAETCCSMESSASRVTPRTVFTTLENGMDASPTERRSAGIVSLLEDGPQRSTSVFCSVSVLQYTRTIAYKGVSQATGSKDVRYRAGEVG